MERGCLTQRGTPCPRAVSARVSRRASCCDAGRVWGALSVQLYPDVPPAHCALFPPMHAQVSQAGLLNTDAPQTRPKMVLGES